MARAETERPVMLYSVGKDSAVMLHLAKKAFFPARPPFSSDCQIMSPANRATNLSCQSR
jgi:3'-phosphoadenosine 5'-phosphosulfate sulfotransferase (PAPS reductase)/FAD synthetase